MTENDDFSTKWIQKNVYLSKEVHFISAKVEEY